MAIMSKRRPRIGSRITAARSAHALTVRQTARAAGVSPSSLARIEADEVSPTLTTLFYLATALDLDPATLVADEQPAVEPLATVPPLDPEAMQLLRSFRALPAARRALVLALVAELAQPDAADLGDLWPQPQRPGVPEPQRETRHYVQGWDRRTAAAHLEYGFELAHTAGAQFSKPFEPIRRGDIIWVVYVQRGVLRLVGRLVVASRRDYARNLRSRRRLDEVIFTQREAEDALGESDLWQAPQHLLAQPGTAAPARDIPVRLAAVRRLRFATTAGESGVKIEEGNGVSGQAFRSVRLLTAGSAEHVERIWHAGSA